jgi:hypothetical protein
MTKNLVEVPGRATDGIFDDQMGPLYAGRYCIAEVKNVVCPGAHNHGFVFLSDY